MTTAPSEPRGEGPLTNQRVIALQVPVNHGLAQREADRQRPHRTCEVVASPLLARG